MPMGPQDVLLVRGWDISSAVQSNPVGIVVPMRDALVQVVPDYINVTTNWYP